MNASLRGTYEDCQNQVKVITGAGNHSVGGRAVIKPAVIEWLIQKKSKYKINFTVGHGHIDVTFH